jgi:urease accessory protein
MPGHPHLLRLLHLGSPALPIGTFHFSQGLEYAVHAGWVADESSALEWIDGLARGALGTLDLPVLVRLHASWSSANAEGVRRWNAFLLAARETQELRAEDRHMGAALRRVLSEVGIATTEDIEQGWSYAATFALACTRWGIAVEDALQTYAWTWTENQVLGAVKLVPLGQSAGQRLLHRLVPRLRDLVEAALCVGEADIGIAAVMHGFASARHETLYTRLFRS